ncbi:MAG TPA: glycosyltransferase family 1 protein [Ignavibacteria bacterium]|nr:glycosyltransferase family 1 protein [Ignavibacteria bacterium]
MKILHFANLGKRRSGLYEAVKDGIKYERKYGIDSQLAIYEVEHPDTTKPYDDWLTPVGWDWADGCDLIVIHRGLPEKVRQKCSKKPTVMVIHGTADYLILDGVASKGENQNLNAHINLMRSFDVSVAVNPLDFEIYKLYDQKGTLELIHDAIDMERFTIDGYSHPYMNHPMIMFADTLRINKNPSHVIWAMNEVCQKIPEARLSLYGLPLDSIMTWRNLILRSKHAVLESCCEDINLQMSEIRPFMRGADILYNSNTSGIPSRVEIEAMACGCQIISSGGDFTKWIHRGSDIKDIAKNIIDCWEYIKQDVQASKKEARAYALEHFNMETKVVEQYLPLYNRVIEGAKNNGD